MPADRRSPILAAALLLSAGLSAAAAEEPPLPYEPESASLAVPAKLAMLQPGPQDESVYAPPAPPSGGALRALVSDPGSPDIYLIYH